ncbi:MAG TPA: hypothetical protein VFM05_08050 [Candidatus Saccharimonadales bacterium]|nr:hypothetical protein [Candidatus Saccharimonadales bacterium]
MEEYTKHVQATHFALTLLTFALLVMSIGREPSETEEALRQIKTIHSAVQSWDPRFLEAFARKRLKEQGMSESFDPAKEFSLNHREIKEQFSLVFIEPAWTLHPLPETLAKFDESYRDRFVERYDYDQKTNDYLRGRTLIGQPSTLNEFVSLWDSLQESVHILKAVDVARTCYVHNVFGQPAAWTALSSSPASAPQAKQLRMLFRAPTAYEKTFFPQFEEFKSKPYSHLFTGGIVIDSGRQQWEVELPALTDRVLSFKGQTALNEKLGVNWMNGSFAESFPQLERESVTFRDMSLDKVTAVLEALARKPTERFEAFGVKIPTVTALTLGIPVLLGLQIYLWLHVKALKNVLRSFPQFSHFPWVGIYDLRVATWLTALTAFAMPVVVVGILLSQEAAARGKLWPWVLAAAGVLLSSYVAISTQRVLTSIRSELRSRLVGTIS